ncbi:MAG: LPS export ABC transporter periplasmic protein LptC [Desulfofustis sp.]|nr:LPS export ABC transporter periplasmic protein LptC [Desulfofustis sp.]MBT8354032.1 LPS export ABC transporter periplasmic protein LptC [Desulfofustis sp.]NNF45138.1 LPS export ABC transporter periplasmic protein LptC [Desulfofustis sp.]NNK13648.1 LPS export ABC transporter periplasmic protein LptC [Desulfofustis sp.]NNK58634.1 LPS export ABC transporter periplasmic protein LptC [Desulfofustis sp.]
MIRLNRRNLVWLIPVLMIVTFPVWQLPISSFLTPRGIEESDVATGTEKEHDFVMQKVLITQNQAGEKTAEIRARQAYTSDKPDEFVLVDVDSDLYDDQGDMVNIKADSGIYNTQTKHLILNKNVVVSRDSQKQQLFTDLLHYYDDKRIIDSPVPTRMVAEGAEIKGSNLRYDIVTGQYLVGGRVHTILQPE